MLKEKNSIQNPLYFFVYCKKDFLTLGYFMNFKPFYLINKKLYLKKGNR